MTNNRKNKEYCNCANENMILDLSEKSKCNNCSKQYEIQDNFDQDNKLNKPGYKKEEHSRLQNEYNEEYVDDYNKSK